LGELACTISNFSLAQLAHIRSRELFPAGLLQLALLNGFKTNVSFVQQRSFLTDVLEEEARRLSRYSYTDEYEA
jgi:hypothetical protein